MRLSDDIEIEQAARAAITHILALAEETLTTFLTHPGEGYQKPSVANTPGYAVEAFRYAVDTYAVMAIERSGNVIALPRR